MENVAYKIEFDGTPFAEEYKSLEDAMSAAKVYFTKDHSLHTAEFSLTMKEPTQLKMINKDFVGTLVG